MARGQCGHAVHLVAIACWWCGRWFCLCRRCYRGHRYCGKRCRKAARKAQQDAARRRHIASDPEAAREDNAQRQRDHRDRQRGPPPNVDDGCSEDGNKAQQGQPDKASVTDQGSTSLDRPLSPCPQDDAHPCSGQQAAATGRPRGRQRCQRCRRYGRVVLWVRRGGTTASFQRLLCEPGGVR